MKKLIYVSLIGFMASCGAGEDKSYIETLTEKRDSLKTEYKEIGSELAKVEADLAALDTNRRVINVTTQKSTIAPFAHYFKVYGSVKTDNNTILYPTAQGEIKAIYVQEGQMVKKGQKLMAIDADIIRQNIEEVKVQLELAEQVYQKQKALWDKNIGSELDYLKAKNNRDALQKSLATLRTQLSKTTVTAPFDGTIDEIMVKNGQLAGAQVGLLRIVNMEEVYLKADIPETYIKTIGSGTNVKLTFPSLKKSGETQIHETSKFINPANRTFSVRVNLENESNQLYPNLLGMLEIRDYANDSALVIPSRLIQEDAAGNSFIFIAEQKEDVVISSLLPIKAGMTYNDYTEVLEGLQPNMNVIDQGARNVSNGQVINVLN